MVDVKSFRYRKTMQMQSLRKKTQISDGGSRSNNSWWSVCPPQHSTSMSPVQRKTIKQYGLDPHLKAATEVLMIVVLVYLLYLLRYIPPLKVLEYAHSHRAALEAYNEEVYSATRTAATSRRLAWRAKLPNGKVVTEQQIMSHQITE